jgi:hypothetical protein
MFESLIWFGKLIGRFISRFFSNSPQLQRFSAEILFGCAGGSAHTFCDILSGVVVKDSHRYWLPVYTFGLWSSSMCPDQFWKLVQWATRHTFNCALHIPISREETFHSLGFHTEKDNEGLYLFWGPSCVYTNLLLLIESLHFIADTPIILG